MQGFRGNLISMVQLLMAIVGRFLLPLKKGLLYTLL